MVAEGRGREPLERPPAATGSLPVARALADAEDQRLLRVVALVDGLGSGRGAADRLLDGVRPRLASLRPPRLLTFTRLLFQPLDPVIVPSAAWRPGDGRLPRGAIAPLGAALRTSLGAMAEQVDAACAGRTTHDAEFVGSVGALLWPAAAAAVARLPGPPAGWETGGPRPDDFPAIAALCTGAWRRRARGEQDRTTLP